MTSTVLLRALACVTGAFLVASCGGLPIVKPTAGTEVAYTEAVVLVPTIDGQPAVARMADGVVICEMAGFNQFVLRKLASDLTSKWSAQVHDGSDARARLDTIPAEQTGEEITS